MLKNLRSNRFTLLFLIVFFLGIESLLAGQYDIKQITPAIESAISNRKARFSQLQDLKSQGAVGEDNQGFVEELRPGASGGLVPAENNDRNVIYEAIATQNQLGPNGIETVKKAFADVQRDKARPGDSIQLPSGERVQK